MRSFTAPEYVLHPGGDFGRELVLHFHKEVEEAFDTKNTEVKRLRLDYETFERIYLKLDRRAMLVALRKKKG